MDVYPDPQITSSISCSHRSVHSFRAGSHPPLLSMNGSNKQITIPSEKYGWIYYIIDPITEGGAAPKPCKEKVTLPGKSKPTIVYLGTRGGKYVKVNGKFVSLKKFK